MEQEIAFPSVKFSYILLIHLLLLKNKQTRKWTLRLEKLNVLLLKEKCVFLYLEKHFLNCTEINSKPAIKRKYSNLQNRFIIGRVEVPKLFLIFRLYILQLNLTRCHVTHVMFCTFQRILRQLGNFLFGLNLLGLVNDDG